MVLKASYESKEDIPEQYVDLFEERGGKFVLTKIDGIKTEADVERVQRSLEEERNKRRELKSKLEKFGDLDPQEVHEKLDDYDAMKAKIEAGGDGGADEETIQKRVDAEVRKATGPLTRERDALKKERDELAEKAENLDGQIRASTRESQIRAAAEKAGIAPSAIDDAILLGERHLDIDETSGELRTRDKVGVTPGVSVADWIEDLKEKRPHWWPASQGAGARGSNGGPPAGDNPWSAKGWNATKQAQIVKSDRDKAEKLAQHAGSYIGATEPPKEE